MHMAHAPPPPVGRRLNQPEVKIRLDAMDMATVGKELHVLVSLYGTFISGEIVYNSLTVLYLPAAKARALYY